MDHDPSITSGYTGTVPLADEDKFFAGEHNYVEEKCPPANYPNVTRIGSNWNYRFTDLKSAFRAARPHDAAAHPESPIAPHEPYSMVQAIKAYFISRIA